MRLDNDFFLWYSIDRMNQKGRDTMKHFLQIIFIMMLCIMLTGCIFTARKVEQTKPVTTTPTTTISTPAYTEIKVSSADEFLQNIKPYTKIILTEDYYNLSSIT